MICFFDKLPTCIKRLPPAPLFFGCFRKEKHGEASFHGRETVL